MIEKDPIVALQEAVEEYGSIANVARRTGISPQFLHDVLSRRRKPSERLLAALGLARIVVKAA